MKIHENIFMSVYRIEPWTKLASPNISKIYMGVRKLFPRGGQNLNTVELGYNELSGTSQKCSL